MFVIDEFREYIWRGGEVVTLRSAKPTCAGSIPAHASGGKSRLLGFRAGIEDPADVSSSKPTGCTVPVGEDSRLSFE